MIRTSTLTRRVIAILLILLLSFALYSPLAAQDGSSVDEPNDSLGSATLLTFGAAVESRIAPEGDVDWFAVDAPSAGELAITIDNIDPALELSIRVWDGDFTLVTDPLVAGESRALSGIADLAESGRYFLEVVSDSRSASQRPWTLEVSLAPTVDTGEPNNRLGDATWIGDDQSVQANILPAYDDDWYWLEVDDAGELSIEIDNVAETMTMSVRVWNRDFQEYSGWFSSAAPGEPVTGVADLPAAGEYYIEVMAEADGRSAQPYTLAWSFKPTRDGLEPNDRFSDATLLTLGAYYTATIFPAYDNDIYAIVAPDQGELRVEISEAAENLAIAVQLYDNNQTVVGNWVYPDAPGGNTYAVFDLPKGGRYFLKVVDEGQNERSISPYRIAVDLILTEDVLEPNNSFGHAAVLGLAEVISATILPAGDRDWFRVELPSAGELHVMAVGVPDALGINLRLLDADMVVIDGLEEPGAPGEVVAFVYDAPAAGSYYIDVLASDASGRSVQPYVLVPSSEPIDVDEFLAQAEVVRADAAQKVAAVELPGQTIEKATTENAATEDVATEEGAAEETDIEAATTETTEETTGNTADEEPTTAQSGETDDAAGGGESADEIDLTVVTIDVPEGWVREDGEEIVVRLSGDEDTLPGAPLLRIVPAGAVESDVLSILDGGTPTLTMLEEPEEVVIGDATAVVFALQEEVDGVLLSRRYLLLNVADGSAWQVVLESGAESWDESLPDLEAILESIDFGTP